MTAEMKDDVIAFWSGSLLSGIPAFQWLMQADLTNGRYMAVAWTIKVLGTMILGVIGGIAGMLGKDIYKKLKQKLNKDEST